MNKVWQSRVNFQSLTKLLNWELIASALAPLNAPLALFTTYASVHPAAWSDKDTWTAIAPNPGSF